MTAVNRYLLDPGLQSPKTSRTSAGIDYAFRPQMRVNATYRYARGEGFMRGENLNAPIDGVRPNPLFGNVVEVVADAKTRQHVLQISGQSAPPAPPGG